MQEGFVNINNIPTLVTTFGRWITENPDENEDEEIILIIPANNGSSGFYRLFMQILHTKYLCPVWIIANSGHDLPPLEIDQGVPKKVLSLKEQTLQKISFFEKYIPETAKVHLIGHSIGCHMALELLKIPEIEKRIVKTCLLFPLIERLNEGKKGISLKKKEKFLPVIIFFAWLLYILPEIISTNLLTAFNVPKKDIPFIISSSNPKVLKQVFHVAFETLLQIRERDNYVIRKYMHKIRMLYEEGDGWMPLTFYDDLKRDFPKLKTELVNFKHAFYFRNSFEVAEIVVKWISEEPIRYY